jgi:hypothetical protein
LATLESRPLAEQRGIEYSDEEGLQQQLLAMDPERFKFHRVGDFAGSQSPAGATGANENNPSPRHRAKATLK